MRTQMRIQQHTAILVIMLSLVLCTNGECEVPSAVTFSDMGMHCLGGKDDIIVLGDKLCNPTKMIGYSLSERKEKWQQIVGDESTVLFFPEIIAIIKRKGSIQWDVFLRNYCDYTLRVHEEIEINSAARGGNDIVSEIRNLCISNKYIAFSINEHATIYDLSKKKFIIIIRSKDPFVLMNDHLCACRGTKIVGVFSFNTMAACEEIVLCELRSVFDGTVRFEDVYLVTNMNREEGHEYHYIAAYKVYDLAGKMLSEYEVSDGDYTYERPIYDARRKSIIILRRTSESINEGICEAIIYNINQSKFTIEKRNIIKEYITGARQLDDVVYYGFSYKRGICAWSLSEDKQMYSLKFKTMLIFDWYSYAVKHGEAVVIGDVLLSTNQEDIKAAKMLKWQELM